MQRKTSISRLPRTRTAATPAAEVANGPKAHAEVARAEQPNGKGEGKRDYGAYEIKVVAADGAKAECRVGGWRGSGMLDE